MKKQATLTPRDETTLPAIARYAYMDAEQIQRLVYPAAKTKTATKRLTELLASYDEDTRRFNDDGYLSYGLVHEKDGSLLGRPKRHFYISPQNLRFIESAYAKRGKLDQFSTDFADAITIKNNHASLWSRTHILHELKITDYGLAFNHPTQQATQFFWERTSPKSEGISKSFTVNKLDPRTNRTQPMTVRLNPDSVDLALDPRDTDERPTAYLSLIEVDRATESTTELAQKIYAYDELAKPRNPHLPELRDYFISRYGLALHNPLFTQSTNYRFNARVRFVTISTQRRNEIIRLIAERSQYPALFHVTTFDELEKWEHFFTHPHWHAASDYVPILKREDREAKALKRAAFNVWRDEQIEKHISPLPYFHTARRAQEETAS